jgi:flavin reductase (DIM6/NTAB) family NADH-FMN oxidoreductase RutF
MDDAVLRPAFSCFPSGVVALAALGGDGTPLGMAASSFTSVSLDPPLVSVCVAHTSSTWPLLRESAEIGLSVLADDHADACRRLSARDADRFAGTSWQVTDGGGVLIDGTPLQLTCRVEQEIVAGDHAIVLLEILDLAVDLERQPLIFHHSRFRAVAG